MHGGAALSGDPHQRLCPRIIAVESICVVVRSTSDRRPTAASTPRSSRSASAGPLANARALKDVGIAVEEAEAARVQDRSINLVIGGSFAAWSRQDWIANARNAVRIGAWLAVQDCRKYGFTPRVIKPPYPLDPPGISDSRGCC
jgi:hypothetical protein